MFINSFAKFTTSMQKGYVMGVLSTKDRTGMCRQHE